MNFRLSGQKIALSKSLRYLGITLDEHLTWSPQLNNLAKKLSHANGVLSKVRHYVTFPTLRNIYFALFNSHLIFGCQIWGQKNSLLLERIIKLQNKALRIINFKNIDSQIDPLYAESKILKLRDYVYLLNCQLIKNFSLNNLPTCFEHFFTEIGDIHGYETRAAMHKMYSLSTSNTTYNLNSVKNKSIHAWNEIRIKIGKNPDELSYNTLTNEIKNYFFKEYKKQ